MSTYTISKLARSEVNRIKLWRMRRGTRSSSTWRGEVYKILVSGIEGNGKSCVAAYKSANNLIKAIEGKPVTSPNDDFSDSFLKVMSDGTFVLDTAEAVIVNGNDIEEQAPFNVNHIKLLALSMMISKALILSGINISSEENLRKVFLRSWLAEPDHEAVFNHVIGTMTELSQIMSNPSLIESNSSWALEFIGGFSSMDDDEIMDTHVALSFVADMLLSKAC